MSTIVKPSQITKLIDDCRSCDPYKALKLIEKQSPDTRTRIFQTCGRGLVLCAFKNSDVNTARQLIDSIVIHCRTKLYDRELYNRPLFFKMMEETPLNKNQRNIIKYFISTLAQVHRAALRFCLDWPEHTPLSITLKFQEDATDRATTKASTQEQREAVVRARARVRAMEEIAVHIICTIAERPCEALLRHRKEIIPIGFSQDLRRLFLAKR